MSDRTPNERIANLETSDQYERRALEIMQKSMESLRDELQTLKDWKHDCDQMSRVWLRIAMAFSLVATSLGVWLENIKASLKALFIWVSS